MTIGVGVIGMGVMGQAHARAVQYLQDQGMPVELRAMCSRRMRVAEGSAPSRGNLDAMGEGEQPLRLAGVRPYADHAALLADPDLHAVFVATYTETHVAIALDALAAGKHVLVEKPVALSLPEVERLAAAVPPGLVCMPAFCMRFWPGWPWLKEQIDSGAFGALRSLWLRRLSEPPGWSPWFYGDVAQTGNALWDLHVHDADFALWCCGAPQRVAVTGTPARLTALYGYPQGPGQVVVDGGYVPVEGFNFQMRYLAVFDEAVADFQHDRSPSLHLTRAGGVDPVELPAETAYVLQARHFIEQVLGTSAEPPRATMADAVNVTRLLEWEAGVLAGER
jgi:predicted dehydrogenase